MWTLICDNQTTGDTHVTQNWTVRGLRWITDGTRRGRDGWSIWGCNSLVDASNVFFHLATLGHFYTSAKFVCTMTNISMVFLLFVFMHLVFFFPLDVEIQVLSLRLAIEQSEFQNTAVLFVSSYLKSASDLHVSICWSYIHILCLLGKLVKVMLVVWLVSIMALLCGSE